MQLPTWNAYWWRKQALLEANLYTCCAKGLWLISHQGLVWLCLHVILSDFVFTVFFRSTFDVLI